MALLEVNFRSKMLTRSVSVNVILPEPSRMVPTPYKTLWLLHGLSDDHTAWLRKTSIERYAEQHGIAVVMPAVDRSWYTDTQYDAKYFSYVTEELPYLCREFFNNLSEEREYNFIGGLSMGGYGAMKAALTFPDKYFACISLSGALDVTGKYRTYNLDEWKSIFGYNMVSASELTDSRHDLFYLASRNVKYGETLPDIYMWCGDNDPLLEVNRAFDSHLTQLGVKHSLDISEGDHTWKWWDLHIQKTLDKIFVQHST